LISVVFGRRKDGVVVKLAKCTKKHTVVLEFKAMKLHKKPFEKEDLWEILKSPG